ncbi:hypothetical protein Nepgr_016552 [Nepenthes gracilis]|uniref:Uncharacterized protein n=1 Tax=Nepenthes gracilis TaxID=150966 RepID=A0AAD3SQJ2_NEPGR|nr:hypothetical protein Nepgr_016552 [Nepenthes gracilis]
MKVKPENSETPILHSVSMTCCNLEENQLLGELFTPVRNPESPHCCASKCKEDELHLPVKTPAHHRGSSGFGASQKLTESLSTYIASEPLLPGRSPAPPPANQLGILL